MLTHAISDRDIATIGEVATRSSLMNQKLYPKRTLEDMLRVCRVAGGLGVVSAHSGTLVGVLLADDDPDYFTKLDKTMYGCRELAGNAVAYRSRSYGSAGSLVSSTGGQGGA
jgi:L-threonine kinase